MHGHERCAKDECGDHDELHAWLHAVQCEDTGRILDSAEPKVKASLHALDVDIIDELYVFEIPS